MWYNNYMVQYRKDKLVNGEYYHIFSRSIAKYVIFNNDKEYLRMLDSINLLRFIDFDYKMSKFNELKIQKQNEIINILKTNNKTFTDIVAYCIMPTHIHLILKQNIDNGITKYMAKLLNSYAKYFNTKHKRKGHLWTDRFKSVLITNNEQILHLTRYIHLNPVSAKLVRSPKKWQYSSFFEYINPDKNNICTYKNIFDLKTEEYEKFVLNRIDYQQKLSLIKNLIIDEYSG